MPKIGVVLAGGMSKVAYEIGCLQAILEKFGKEQIVAVTASSIGVLPGYALCCNKLSELASKWENLSDGNSKKMMLRLSKNNEIISRFSSMIAEDDEFSCELIATLWNYTQSRAEYISLFKKSPEKRLEYMKAAIAIPVVNKSVRIQGDSYFDGAFLDNIPVFPLIEKDLDYIFCIYFDGWNYQFENKEFDQRVIKLNQFPDKSGMDFMFYDPSKTKEMIKNGYQYANLVINDLFVSSQKEEIYAEIQKKNIAAKNRITTEILLTNLNKAMSRFSKREIL